MAATSEVASDGLQRFTGTVNFQTLVNFSPAGVILTRGSSTGAEIVYVNDAFTKITGYSISEVAGRNCRFLQGARTDLRSIANIREAIATHTQITIELLNYRKNGEEFWNELTIGPEFDENGACNGFIGVVNDVTVRRKLEGQRSELQARLASIIENLPGYVFQRTLKTGGKVELTYVSPYLRTMLGLPPNPDGESQDLWDSVHLDDRGTLRQSIERSAAEMSELRVEFRLITATGGERWIRNYSKPRRLETGELVWDGVGLDITAERLAEERLSYLAYHDPLTGLPNRLLFQTSLERALNSERTSAFGMALLLVDIDGFQEINDTAGMLAGDSILRALSKRIADFSERRAGYFARTGGDEFAAFFDVAEQRDPSSEAQSLCRELMQPLFVDERDFAIEACVGVAVFPFSAASEEPVGGSIASELMKRANIALQAAKQAGRGMQRVYSHADDDRQRNQAIVRQSMRKAIEEQQFRLHYHPLVDLASGEIVGAEALVRWSHPILGMQRPDMFIPLAEKTGLIVPLGAWVMGEAMRQAMEWAGRGAKVPKIAINVSGVQLLDPDFIGTVERALAETGAKASQFELELTEGFMIEASNVVSSVLGALKRMGFTLSIDDFGTGYSSFRRLRDFPVDKVKIDQTFVRQMVVDSSDASIIRAIITLANSLKLDVVAEGIETVAQRNLLRDEGCKVGQGYLFSLPLAAEDFGYLLDRGVTLPMAPPSDGSTAVKSEMARE